MVIGGKEQSGIVNPIPAGGEGQFDPPPSSFFYITQKVLVWAVEIFWIFLHTQSPPFRPKTGL